MLLILLLYVYQFAEVFQIKDASSKKLLPFNWLTQIETKQ